MAISKVSGQMLRSNLVRDGLNLSISSIDAPTPIFHVDVANARIGINNSDPAHALDITGTMAVNLITAHSTAGNVTFQTTGAGVVSISAAAAGGSVGIEIGTPTQGSLVSNAVTLTTTTSVTDSVALLNRVLGKLIPPAPPLFPNATTLVIGTLSTYRMCNFVQTDNNAGTNKSVAAGTVVSTVRRSALYSTNTITNTGPGDAGQLTVHVNGVQRGVAVFNPAATPTANGLYGGNLIVTNNYDYHNVIFSVAPEFWYVFSSSLGGTVTPGWNDAYITSTANSITAASNTVIWYYDSSAPGTPQFTSATVTAPALPSYTYSSTIPHYNNTNQFVVGYNVNRLSGDMYPTVDAFSTGSAGGAFIAPVTKTYSQAGITTPLLRNMYVSSGTATIATTAGIVSGFGSNAAGLTVSVANSYATGSATIAPAGTVLFKTGTSNAIEETSIPTINIGGGGANAFRIINPGAAGTPEYSGSEAAFNSQTSTLTTTDAVVVGNGVTGVLKHDQTNYSTGYLPAGPDLSAGRSGAQYFTVKLVRSNVSKFDISFTGTLAGLWVALPGSPIDASSSINGWMDMTISYAGSGYPGALPGPGNDSDGCSLGGAVVINTSGTQTSTCTFGTVSSSSTDTNDIYIRIALTSGQSVTALSFSTATN
jgi:hypothetical protein